MHRVPSTVRASSRTAVQSCTISAVDTQDAARHSPAVAKTGRRTIGQRRAVDDSTDVIEADDCQQTTGTEVEFRSNQINVDFVVRHADFCDADSEHINHAEQPHHTEVFASLSADCRQCRYVDVL